MSRGAYKIASLRHQISTGSDILPSTSLIAQQLRLKSSDVPEYWGRDSPYHGGTDFLGTPKNHLDLVKNRPVSPHVFEINNKEFHYKMPMAAISSITNRATGTMLSVGFGLVGYIALTGDVTSAIQSFKSSYPLLVFPAKFATAFPLTYHYLAGVRHMYWDHYKYGNQADKMTPLEKEAVERSSKMVLGGGAALAAAMAVITV